MRKATLHLAQSDPAPCKKQPCTLAQSKGGVLAEPSHRASKQLAQHEGEMDLKKGLAFFFLTSVGLSGGKPSFWTMNVRHQAALAAANAVMNSAPVEPDAVSACTLLLCVIALPDTLA